MPDVAYERRNRVNANRSLLDAIEALWERCPDMRFGQLVMNLSREPGPGRFADTWEWKHGAWYERIQEASETWAKL